MDSEDDFPFCDKEEEIINHTFVNCDLAFHVWSTKEAFGLAFFGRLLGCG